MKDLVYSIPIDTFEENGWNMLLQQFAITKECWKEWKNHFVGAFIIVLSIDNNGAHFEHFL
jgi:hypothetical protein